MYQSGARDAHTHSVGLVTMPWTRPSALRGPFQTQHTNPLSLLHNGQRVTWGGDHPHSLPTHSHGDRASAPLPTRSG